MTKDPVCGMAIDAAHAECKVLDMGEEVFFCSERCKRKFAETPQKCIKSYQEGRSQAHKVVVVGAGQVGATICFALMMSGLASTIILLDIDAHLAEGQAMDLNHGLPFVRPARIFAGDYSDCKNADIVIVAAGTAQKAGETRLDLVRKNTDIFKDIIPKIAVHEPQLLLIVSNPVDILTYVALKVSSYPMNRVIGSGTILDTARFRFLLSRHCRVDPRNVHAYIIGEHGDSEVPVWSLVSIAGLSLEQFTTGWDEGDAAQTRDEISRQVKRAAYEIIDHKGYTNFAIALAVERMVSSILRDENSVLTVSSLLEHYHDVTDVCLSVPTIVNRNGIYRQIGLQLDASEIERLRFSAQALQRVIAQLGI